jgi:hypothetical protein
MLMDSYQILHTKTEIICYYCNNPNTYYIDYIFHFIENKTCLNHSQRKYLDLHTGCMHSIVGYIYG